MGVFTVLKIPNLGAANKIIDSTLLFAFLAFFSQMFLFLQIISLRLKCFYLSCVPSDPILAMNIRL